MSLPTSLSYFSSLRIPESKLGRWEVVHKIIKEGTSVDVLNMRDALFGFGGKPKSMVLKSDHLVHEILEDGDRWMSDCPSEIYTQYELFKRFKGNVLVGGLGLGYACEAIAELPDVMSVTVVEIQPDVIKLVWKHLKSKKVTLVQGDLYHWLQRCESYKRKYDYAFYDIWCPTGERALSDFVIPLRRASQGIIEQKNIENWGEPTMLGQVRHGIYNHIEMWENEPFSSAVGGSLREKDEDFFKRTARGIGVQWTFLNWMRKTHQRANTEVRRETLRAKADLFIDALRDPQKFEKDWVQWGAE